MNYIHPTQVNHFKDYIPQAFKNGNDLILDAEVLLIDTNTSKPLPFGTLGVHKVRDDRRINSFPIFSIYLYFICYLFMFLFGFTSV